MGIAGAIPEKYFREGVQDLMAIWQIDGSHSAVEFVVKHMMVSKTKGRFTNFNGTIELDENNLASSSVTVEIDVASIDTHDEKRDAHLRSGDFFDAEKYPTITFTSTEVLPRGGDKFQVVGDLTIRDVTRSVVLQGEFLGVTGKGTPRERIGFEASTTINRLDYGVKWNRAIEGGGVLLGDEVEISIGIAAVRM